MIRDSLWPQVRQHAWKYQVRTAPITGILWHSTRGNQGYPGEIELGAYMNWAKSPNNKIQDYAGIASYGIGPGRIVECVPDQWVPRFSSWPSDASKVSVEIAQSNRGQAIEPETIEACVVFAKEKAAEYGFPLTRVFPVNDSTWVGMAGHEDTVQGKASGKSDPGPEFWVPFMAALEDDMTQEEREELAALVSIFGGRQKLLEAQAQGMDYLLGYALEQADQNKLEEAVAKLSQGGFAGVKPGTRFSVEVVK